MPTRNERDKAVILKRQFYIQLAVTLGILAVIFIVMLAQASRGLSAMSEVSPVVIESPSPSVEILPIAVVSVEPSLSPEPILRYGFTDDEVYLLAQLLCGSKDTDGDGEYDFDFKKELDYNEISKVLCVVMNRVRSDKYPDTVKKVVMQMGQFSVMPENSHKTVSSVAINETKAWCDAYDSFDPGAQVCPEDHLYFSGNGFINVTR